MIPFPPVFRLIVPLLAVAAPGIYAWWSGRRILPQLDDPAFADMLLARSTKIARILGVSWVVILVVGSRHAAWAIPAAILAALVGGFPARKVIFDEEWGLGGFVSHHLRVIVGLFGPWFLVVAAPLVYRAKPDAIWVASALLVGVVALWSVMGGKILLRLLRATPLEDKTLLDRFRALLESADCAPPRVYRAGPLGGSWVNGFAIPNPSRPGVLLTDGLMAHLDEDEVTAIFAHEVAHLEDLTGRKWLARTVAAPVFAVVISLVFLLIAPSSAAAGVVAIAWPALVIVAFLLSLSHSRNDETKSDLRAVALTGDPDALVRALTKIHALNRMPRRLDARIEQRITHPSLARRLQAIQESSAEREDIEIGWLAMRAVGDAETVVVLGPERLQYFEGVGPECDLEPQRLWEESSNARATKYSDLQELRVDARDSAKRFLVAVDRRGQRINTPLDIDDAQRVQEHLDRVDRLIGKVEKRPGEWAASKNTRVLGIAGILASLLPPVTWSLGVAGLIVVLWPTRAALAVAGVAGILGLVAVPPIPTPPGLGRTFENLTLVLQGILGAWLVAVAMARLHRRVEDAPRATRAGLTVAVVLGLSGAVLGSGIVTGASTMMQVHLWARTLPGSVALLAGAAAGLLLVQNRKARLIGLGVGALAAVLLASGTEAFRSRVPNELLAQTPPHLESVESAVEHIRTVDFDHSIQTIRISPTGGRLAVSAWSDDEFDYRERSSVFQVEVGDGYESVRAIDLRWIDDESIVALVPDTVGLLVREIRFASGDSWQTRVADIGTPSLQANGSGWSVLGRDSTGRALVGFFGTLGRSGASKRRWELPNEAESWIQSGFATTDGRARAVANRGYVNHGPLPTLGFGAYQATTELWVGAEAELDMLGGTALSFTCFEPSRDGAQLCIANSVQSTELWLVGGDAGVSPLGRLAGWRWGNPSDDGVVVEGGTDLIVIAYDPLRIHSISEASLTVQDSIGRDAPDSKAISWRHSSVFSNDVLAVAQGDGQRASVSLFRLSQ